ncbi:MAG: hypothetical protein EBT54_01215 [Betaproteobacteria bacterium]|nr:hypothetical protein [Betaproteobacteria bacterium]
MAVWAPIKPALPVTMMRMLSPCVRPQRRLEMRRYTDTLRRCGRDPLHPVSLTTTPPTVRYGWTLLAVLLLGLTVLRLVVRSNLDIDLHYDEAQYAVWSMQPDWGYYSKPPLIAWAIAAARGVCGDSAFCVRLPSAIAFTVTPLLVFALGRELWPYRPSVAWLGAGLFTLAPLTNFYALFMTTDSLLLLCWSAALLVLVRAIRLGGGWWPLLGIALGFGLLAKYTMGIFAVSSVMALWLMPQLRRVLVLPGPWMALFIAVLMFAPNLWWNAVHDFPTWHHTAEIAQIDRAGNGLGGLFEFIGAQIVIFGPLAFAAAAYSVRRGLQAPVAPTDIGPGQAMPIPALRFLVCFAVPFLAIICVQAGLSRAFANWAAPAYHPPPLADRRRAGDIATPERTGLRPRSAGARGRLRATAVPTARCRRDWAGVAAGVEETRRVFYGIRTGRRLRKTANGSDDASALQQTMRSRGLRRC